MLSINLPFSKSSTLKKRYLSFVFICFLSNSGMATWLTSSDALVTLPDEHINKTENTEDPMEDVNRSVFRFNQDIDQYIVKPLTEIYQTLLPKPAQESAHNVISNINSPVIFFNDVLQGNSDLAIDTLSRFLINTTLGIFGLFDPASEVFDIPYHEEDFGETLGTYGVGDDCYLVLPLIGPSNPRDLTGIIVDFIIDPFGIIARKHKKDYLIYTRWGAEGIDKRIEADGVLNQINASSDPYIRMRSIYTQNRNFNINKGIVDIDSPVPLDEEDFAPTKDDE